MDFDFFYIKFLKVVEILKKLLLHYVFLFFGIVFSLYYYVNKTFIENSSIEYSNYILKKDKKFLENEQFGIYENIRKIILTNQKKDENNFEKEQEINFKKFISHNQVVYSKLYKLSCCVKFQNNNTYKNNFALLNLEGSQKWNNLFLIARLMSSSNEKFNHNINFFNTAKYVRNFVILEKKYE